MNKRNKHIIAINSKDSTQRIGLNEYVFNFREQDLHEVKKIQFKEASIVNLLYNIYDKNNVLDYNINGLDASITIPQGFYNAETLQDAINNAQTDIVFAIDLTTYKYNVTSATNSYIKTSGTINKVIGFTVQNTPAVAYSGNHPFNFIRTNFINVISNLAEIDACISSNQYKYKVICSIPVNLPFGYVLQKSEELDSADVSVHEAHLNVSEVSIKITDDDFNPIDLNGGDFILHFSTFK
jgi:hypothetical protein